MPKFKLDASFVAQFARKQPQWGPLGYVTYKRTYARSLESENRTEEFWETLERVVDGTYELQRKHCLSLRLHWDDDKAQRSAQKMFRLMWDFKFLPPGRGLQVMGTPLVDKLGNAALQNCAFVSTEGLATDFAAPFCFLMDMSMLGVGVGGDTLGAGTVTVQRPAVELYAPHVVADTREGWVDLVARVLRSFVGLDTLPTLIDYSQVRPYGSPVRGMGGTASGPGPLAQLTKDLQDILNPLVGHRITSTAIVDVFNAIGKCVVSGNVRRTAEIMFGSPFDPQFLQLKDPTVNAERLEKWGWASNNSLTCELGTDYAPLVTSTTKNGEPGFFWMSNAQAYGRMADAPDRKDFRIRGTNPCGEISLESFEFCTLVETFPANHRSLDEWVETLKYAYLYAKTVTLVPSHDPRSNAVMLRNRRIGVSQSGIAQAIAKFGWQAYRTACDTGYRHLRRVDTKYSEWLCVPQSVKLTTVKPSGTVSLLCGASPGIHYPYAKYYWRTIRFDTSSPLVPVLQAAGYRTVVGSTPNTVIVYFPVKEENHSRDRDQLSIWEQAELAAQMQHWWADNQVSVTITFNKDESSSLCRVLEFYETRMKAVSFLPLADHQYEHAPYQVMENSEQEYLAAVSKLQSLEKVLGIEKQQEALFCDSDKCEVR